jgi:hypothetical protein
MPPTPHDDLHPTARDHAQKEGREESHCDLRVKHCHWPRETLVLRSRLSSLQIRHFMRRQDLAEAQFDDFERRDLLHAGRSRCRYG